MRPSDRRFRDNCEFFTLVGLIVALYVVCSSFNFPFVVVVVVETIYLFDIN